MSDDEEWSPRLKPKRSRWMTIEGVRYGRMALSGVLEDTQPYHNESGRTESVYHSQSDVGEIRDSQDFGCAGSEQQGDLQIVQS